MTGGRSGTCGSTTAARNRPSADTSYCVAHAVPTPPGAVPRSSHRRASPTETEAWRRRTSPRLPDSPGPRSGDPPPTESTTRSDRGAISVVSHRRSTLARAFQASGNSRRRSRSAPIDSRSRRPSGHRAISRLAGSGIRRFEMARTVTRAWSSTRARSWSADPRTSSGRAVVPRPGTSRGRSTKICSRSAAPSVLIHPRRSSTGAPRERPGEAPR